MKPRLKRVGSKVYYLKGKRWIPDNFFMNAEAAKEYMEALQCKLRKRKP